MLKPSSNGWIRLSYLALIPVLAILVYACNPTKKSKTPEPEPQPAAAEVQDVQDVQDVQKTIPFQLVEQKPTFQGGDANQFARYVNEHLIYPESAKAAGIQGRVTLQFVVDTDGSMSDVKVLRGVHPDLDAEALRVFRDCKEKWTPGMQNGVPVRVTYTFPIIFKIQ